MKQHIWEIDDKFLCPVAGFCLSAAEQQSILRKYVPKEKQKSVAKTLHDFLIDNIASKTPIAKHVQKLLDHKYSAAISKYWDIDAKSWIASIDSLLNWQDFGALTYISAMYKPLEEKEIVPLLGKIHNYSHQMYYELIVAETSCQTLSDQFDLIHDKYTNIKHKQKSAEKELAVLKDNNNRLTFCNKGLLAQLQAHQKEAHHTKELIAKNGLLEQQLQQKEQEIATLKRENKQFAKKTESNLSSFVALKSDFDKLLESIKHQHEKCKDCDKIDLQQRSVLLVGGITKMESFYRKLIQDLGGNFYYHDGYCRQDESTIDNMVRQSDIVICPVDVNSHAACLQVKKACKKNGINYYMLRKSSISSVYNTLREVATG